ncbi:aspartic peptidase domain-containing protein [Melanogaster broomeanus]|nr:aspartic peptidase domain-containing protein [Melanogaster broomeanus]
MTICNLIHSRFSYGSGSFSGDEFYGTVSLSPGLPIPGQSMGVVASMSTGFNGVDGVLGLSPTDLNQGTVSSERLVSPAISFMRAPLWVAEDSEDRGVGPHECCWRDDLLSQGTIFYEVLGIYLAPTISLSDDSGEPAFGDYDNSVTTSDVNYVFLSMTFPASTFWGINQSISYGGTTTLSQTAGIIDTGTTLILPAVHCKDAFQTYQQATGGIMDHNTGLLSITASQNDNLQSLTWRDRLPAHPQCSDLAPFIERSDWW